MTSWLQERARSGDFSPAALLSGGALVVMASGRLAHALIVLAALLWTHCASALIAFAGSRIFPSGGRRALFAFVASFAAALYLLLLWLAFPLAALQSFFFVSFVPLFCAGSGLQARLENKGLSRALRISAFEAARSGVPIVALSIARELFGHRSLSLPGGDQGMMVFYPFGPGFPFFLSLLSVSSGALLLLGCILWAHRRAKARRAAEEDA
ncbi:MAG: hypothetical protein FWE09_07630 [Treponema sp.]|nr:hypothetical protein [Treponema sp.]